MQILRCLVLIALALGVVACASPQPATDPDSGAHAAYTRSFEPELWPRGSFQVSDPRSDPGVIVR